MFLSSSFPVFIYWEKKPCKQQKKNPKNYHPQNPHQKNASPNSSFSSGIQKNEPQVAELATENQISKLKAKTFHCYHHVQSPQQQQMY